MELKVKVENRQGDTLAEACGAELAWLEYDSEYEEGDLLAVESSDPNCYLHLQLDDAMAPALVFLQNNRFALPIPFGEKKLSYSPRAFAGSRHLITARNAAPGEIAARRDLAFNPWDCHENETLFPHASANVETRGESVFAARNAIDGCRANTFHGEWPHTSWGINRDPNARWTLEFGRPVILDEAVITLRADFPHDAWWKNATLHFSDGSSLTVSLDKTGWPQSFRFPPKTVEWVALDTLVKADDPSPFPALTLLELYGTEA